MSLDQRKRLPDLIVHHSFYDHIVRSIKGWDIYFNLKTVSNLTVYSNSRHSCYVCVDGDVHDACLELEPHYGKCVGTGVLPHITSYTFDQNMRMYRLGERAPRYVIWTVNELVPVCATILTRTDLYNLIKAVNAAIDWAKRRVIIDTSSVVVFDLDQTLIDDEDRILDGALDALDYARSGYDIMVLWSHGSALHVDKHVADFSKRGVNFDLVLSNPQNAEKSCKNLLYLYNFFTCTQFTKAVLIDDSAFNWTPEYTHFVVPTTPGSVKQMTRALQKCERPSHR